MKLTDEIKIYCGNCGAVLEVYKDEDEEGKLRVVCEACMESQFQDGYDEGKDVGYRICKEY